MTELFPKVYIHVPADGETLVVSISQLRYTCGGVALVASSRPPHRWDWPCCQLFVEDPIQLSQDPHSKYISQNPNCLAGTLIENHFIMRMGIPVELIEVIRVENLAQPTGKYVQCRLASLEVWKINRREEWSRLVLLFNPDEL